jgi:hypothetical protein
VPPEKPEKKPDDMTTDELLDHVFPKEVADALRDAVTEKPEQIPTDEDDSE